MSQNRILIAGEADVETWAKYAAELDCHTRVTTSADVLDRVAEWRPNLVVLDPMMSDGYGFDICRKIKRNVDTPRTMVLMGIHLGELSVVERAIEAGADDFLSKPVNEVEFLKRVENMLKLSRL